MKRRSLLAQLTAALLTVAFALNAGGAMLATCDAMRPGGSDTNHAGMTQSDHHGNHGDGAQKVVNSADRSTDRAVCHQVLLCGNASISLNRDHPSAALLLPDAPISNQTKALQPRFIHPEPPPPKA